MTWKQSGMVIWSSVWRKKGLQQVSALCSAVQCTIVLFWFNLLSLYHSGCCSSAKKCPTSKWQLPNKCKSPLSTEKNKRDDYWLQGDQNKPPPSAYHLWLSCWELNAPSSQDFIWLMAWPPAITRQLSSRSPSSTSIFSVDSRGRPLHYNHECLLSWHH